MKIPFTFKSIADQMTEKILDSLPTGTEVFKIMG